eukprot:5688528-Amphidinium_carterae.1
MVFEFGLFWCVFPRPFVFFGCASDVYWMLVVSSGLWKNVPGLPPWNVDVGVDPYDIFAFSLIGWDGFLKQETCNAKTNTSLGVRVKWDSARVLLAAVAEKRPDFAGLET